MNNNSSNGDITPRTGWSEYRGDVPVNISRDGNLSVDLYDLMMNLDVVEMMDIVADIPEQVPPPAQPEPNGPTQGIITVVTGVGEKDLELLGNMNEIYHRMH